MDEKNFLMWFSEVVVFLRDCHKKVKLYLFWTVEGSHYLKKTNESFYDLNTTPILFPPSCLDVCHLWNLLSSKMLNCKTSVYLENETSFFLYVDQQWKGWKMSYPETFILELSTHIIFDSNLMKERVNMNYASEVLFE